MGTALVTGAVLITVYFAGLGWWSGRDSYAAPGLHDGLLKTCPDSPNCVCSESTVPADDSHAIPGMTLSPDMAGDAWPVIESAIRAAGGIVRAREGDYLHATFTSRIFRYVDDVEFRLDGKQLHWRSASRVGHSDLGANRARIENLRALLEAGN